MLREVLDSRREGEEEKRNIVRLNGIGKKEDQTVRTQGEGGNGFKDGGRREEEYCQTEWYRKKEEQIVRTCEVSDAVDSRKDGEERKIETER